MCWPYTYAPDAADQAVALQCKWKMQTHEMRVICSWKVVRCKVSGRSAGFTVVEPIGERAAVQCGGGLDGRQGSPAGRGGRLVHP